MAQKKAVIGAMAFLLVALIVLGALALAAEVGGKEDPLVGLSYLSGLEPQLKASIDQMAQEKLDVYKQQLESELAQAQAKLDQMSGSGSGPAALTQEDIQAIVNQVKADLPVVSAAPGGTVPSTFTRVEIAKNKTVTLGVGAMFYLRTGTATVYKADTNAGLIDLTDGKVLDSGDIVANHLYSVTFDNNRGFKTSADAIAFIMGPYTVK